jgi:hypothetical protein
MLTPSQHSPLLSQRPQPSPSDGQSQDTILQTLAAFRPIAFNVNFARITGDAKAALMLSQLMYWTKRGTSVLECDGWIFKTRDQWITEIGLGRHEQSTARQTLIELGLIEESRIGHPARNCFRIIPQELGGRLAQLLRTETVQWSLLDIRNDAEHIRLLLGRQFAFHRILVDITASCTSAIYMSKALTIHKRFAAKQTKPNTNTAALDWSSEWFRMATGTTQDETGLSAAQQRKAKESLCELGLLHEAMMEFPRKQIYLRIDTPTLQQKLVAALSACQNQPVDKNQVIHSADSSDAKTFQSNSPFTKNRQNNPPVTAGQVDKSVEFIERTDGTPSATNVSTHSDAKTSQSINAGNSSYRKNRQTESVAGVPPLNQSVEFKSDIGNHHPVTMVSASSDAKTDPPDGQLSHHSWPVLARPTAGFSMLSRQVLTPLHARDATSAGVITNYDYKKEITTTPTSPSPNEEPVSEPNVVVVDFELIWPETLSDWQRDQCQKILNPLVKTDQQDLLDELAGHLLSGGINNPVSYLGALTRKHQATPGGIVFEKLEITRQRRAVQQQIQGGGQGNAATLASIPARPDNALQSDHKPTGMPEYARSLLRTYKGKI